MLQLKSLSEYDSLVAGIGTRSKSSRVLLAVVSADDDSKQGRDGNDAGFLSLTKFHCQCRVVLTSLNSLHVGVRRSYDLLVEFSCCSVVVFSS